MTKTPPLEKPTLEQARTNRQRRALIVKFRKNFGSIDIKNADKIRYDVRKNIAKEKPREGGMFLKETDDKPK